MSSYSSRRAFLQATTASAFGAVIAQHWWMSEVVAQAAKPAPEKRTPLNRFPRMMQEYYVDRMRTFQQTRIDRLAALKTKADAEEYVKSCQTRIRTCLGPHPEKTPLNAQVTAIHKRDGYRIENVIFESRPGFPVTANLYVPTNVEGRRPAVVGTCGHTHNGKAEEVYQAFSQGLVRQGYVCLIFDPIGQGERLQYVDEHLKSHVGVGVREHLKAGNQQFLVDESFSMWRAWDGVRALDYLLTRDEVDPNQIGVTGNSGGGTDTTLLCGVEQRWAMAAPSCYVASLVRNLENELPTDTEQCPPKALAMGLDHEDFLAALAPKPIIILAKEKDFFDVRGTEEAYGRLKRLYQLLGVEKNISLFIGPTFHGYTQENREAMYTWFNRATGTDSPKGEPMLTIEDDATLQCTATGQVSSMGAKTVQDFTRQKAAELAKQRGDIPPGQLMQILKDWIGDRWSDAVPKYRILRIGSGRDFALKYFLTYVVETEPGIQAVVYRLYPERHYSRPPRDSKRAILYVSHDSADAELRDNEALQKLIADNPDTPMYTVDVRGMGESRPNTAETDSYSAAYGCDYMYAIHGVMFDDSYSRQRTGDLLSVLNWLKSVGHEQVHLFANGWGSISGTFAATLHPIVTQVTLQNVLTSFTELAQAEDYDWPLSSMIPGILNRFDLPDCYRSLQSKGLVQLTPAGPIWEASDD